MVRLRDKNMLTIYTFFRDCCCLVPQSLYARKLNFTDLSIYNMGKLG